jgi:NADH-quinone oxidoreductase subunit L
LAHLSSQASTQKDSIIEAVAKSTITGSDFAFFAVMAGVFITAF